MNLSLLVIRCKDLESSREFYESLGLSFTKEKHGNGPDHYACEVSGMVFELYPLSNKPTTDDSRLGFKVKDMSRVISKVKVQTTYEFSGKTIYVAKDPDGRKVEISD